MAEQSASLESIDEYGNGVRIQFSRQGDRFGHTIDSLSGGESEPAFSSVESSEEDADPPSPPFQELHHQDKTLFLTGATTRGHWSMSVREIVVTEQELSSRLFDTRYGLNEPRKTPETRQYVEFEVACRVKSAHNQIGSTYQIRGDSDSVATSEHILTLGTPSLFLGSISLSSKLECCVKPIDGSLIDPKRFLVSPSTCSFDDLPCTVRWRYGIWWL